VFGISRNQRSASSQIGVRLRPKSLFGFPRNGCSFSPVLHNKRIASTATAAPDAVTPISRAYVVESSELVEITRFEDGSIKYTPSGWIVLSTPAQATATAAALRP